MALEINPGGVGIWAEAGTGHRPTHEVSDEINRLPIEQGASRVITSPSVTFPALASGRWLDPHQGAVPQWSGQSTRMRLLPQRHDGADGEADDDGGGGEQGGGPGHGAGLLGTAAAGPQRLDRPGATP